MEENRHMYDIQLSHHSNFHGNKIYGNNENVSHYYDVKPSAPDTVANISQSLNPNDNFTQKRNSNENIPYHDNEYNSKQSNIKQYEETENDEQMYRKTYIKQQHKEYDEGQSHKDDDGEQDCDGQYSKNEEIHDINGHQVYLKRYIKQQEEDYEEELGNKDDNDEEFNKDDDGDQYSKENDGNEDDNMNSEHWTDMISNCIKTEIVSDKEVSNSSETPIRKKRRPSLKKSNSKCCMLCHSDINNSYMQHYNSDFITSTTYVNLREMMTQVLSETNSDIYLKRNKGFFCENCFVLLDRVDMLQFQLKVSCITVF